MKALLQRVSSAQVCVDNETVGEIDHGLLVLVGVEKNDTNESVVRMAERLLNYRIFADADGKMNNSVLQANGGILLVSQFTLAADTRKGLRPGFSVAAPPALAEKLFALLVETVRKSTNNVATGRFGADMQVHLVNDGPVTFLLET